ncbi:putative transposase [Rhodoferax antarcticus ANT.BR]|uniref:Putative transposase n=1 Tax=Rhodoferax antarcticus ANT.BR TaxID=1111071 RepID=A0A1Q8YF86_9BURK|nr:putative transposase [Rhodoferax antarcticus ANT.BR]
MRIIAFITFSADIHKILEHIEVEPEAPRITPARGPPLWDECGAQETREGVEACRTGIWQPSQHQTTPTISALLGELALGRDDCAGVGLCSSAARSAV